MGVHYMRLAFIVNPVFNGWSPHDKRLGGTEESIVRWAEQARAWGHTVDVYSNGFVGEHNGVNYGNRDYYEDGYDVTVNIKSPDMPGDWYLTNEVDAGRHDLSKFKGVIWPSQWAKDHIPVNNSNVQVVPHGYDPDQIFAREKVPMQVLYASSPDRGLDTLLRAWPEVLMLYPKATLIVTYGAPAQNIPNVLFLGEVSETEMNELYGTSDVWCHPCNGGELFGITGIKAQAAGCIPVYFPTMALAETVVAGIKSTPETLVDDLGRAFIDPLVRMRIRLALARYQSQFATWEDSTQRLLETIMLE